ncbi:MAG: MFS transporter [Planctomycetes bacterium]|nr:MFS transporter [Planctomycetota bacterium]
MEKVSVGVRVKLSAMMFFQFMIVAVFFIQLAPYCQGLKMNATLVSLIVSSMAIGCLASPIVGMIADRHFAGQKVLATLNIVGAVMLALAANTTATIPLFILLLAFMLCYMPSWGLTSAIAMANTPPEKFPQVRVFGSIGWVASILFSIVARKVWGMTIDGTNIPLYCGAAVSLIGGLNALMLPNTPPPAKGQPASVMDALGLRTLSLMKDKNFAVFILASFLVMLPFGIHWSYIGSFLSDKGFEMVTAVSYTGQALEVILMLLVPVSLAKLGVKKTMAIGLAAQVVRFLAYYGADVSGVMPITFAGILMHGAIFGFFFVGGQVYISQRAPKEIQAQAQGFIFLVNLGLGLLIANFINGELIKQLKVTTVVEGKAVTSWSSIWMVQIIASVAVLAIFWLFFNHKDAAKTADENAAEA